MSAKTPTVFLSAGEASGDQHGAELARELRLRVPGIRLVGLGGSRMAAQGVELLADLDRLAVLGLAEVVRRLPDLWSLRRQVFKTLDRLPVDLVVPIDYPGFNMPLSRHARRRGIPVLYYIAPQVWAWKMWRARRLAEWADEVCVVFPFERELLERYGATVRSVGHPILDQPVPDVRSENCVLGLFPGSRRQEVERMLPVFLDAATLVVAQRPDLHVLVAQSADLPDHIYSDCPPHMLAEPEAVVRSSRAAITKSGTITLQLAISGVPMVVGYRVNPLTYTILRRLVRVDHIALVNLVAGREVVEELIQAAMTPEALANEALRLLDNTEYRDRMVEQLMVVRNRLGQPGAASRVADACVALLGQRAGTT
ncbi:MAG: lipid-A-disaccharide synthase [Gemmatimonadales bacterium]|nr:MAG: lipid-A-disaccharide synthase [Gemmatimonadales bacterium]